MIEKSEVCSFILMYDILCMQMEFLNQIFACSLFTQAQYHDWIKLLEAVSRFKTYVEVSHLRPVLPVSEAPHLWWRYAAQAGLQQKKMW